MRYHEAANYLFDLRRFRMRPGTGSTRDLLAHLGNPHEDLTCVQVAGSNGKGTTARAVESILREAGLDVGLYTSPHFEDVRERVRVNGRTITEDALAAFVAEIRRHVDDRAADGDPPTFFEVLTAMALDEFARQGVDVAVLEVGIGGRYDSTSVVDPVASAVTTVSLEHTALLGDTVEEIARDKAHVAPADGPLVTAATGEALSAIRDVAGDVTTVGSRAADATDVQVEYGGRTDRDEARVTVTGPDWRVETAVPTPGRQQARNAGVAAVLARQVADVDAETLARGLRRAHWPGRFEVLGHDPLVVLDGAHNAAACEALAETLDEYDYDDLTLVLGAMHDKDHRAMAAALPDPDRVIVTRPRVERAETRDVLRAVYERRDVPAVDSVGAVESAVERALDDAGPDDCVLVTGSLYTVGEARQRWTRATTPVRIDGLDDAEAVLARADVTEAGTWRMRGKAVHRVLRTTVQPRQAQYLKEEMLSIGGECAISALNDQDEELLDVVLMGTLAQFNRLVQKLDAQPFGLPEIGEDVRRTLGIRTDPAAREFPWSDAPAVMGILNVTPDSFHDGGEYDAVEDAVARAEEMVAAGAGIVDVGGESTRPGADPVPVETEIDRVVPVIERIADLDVAVSVDTRKAAVARAALDAGADIVNDVSGLEDPDMRFVAAEYDAPLVVMHSIDAPVVPDRDVAYDDVVGDVIDDLRERVLLAERAGLDRSQILVDPGLGFGKSAAESFELLNRLGELRALGCPIMVGHSHKSMFGEIDRYPDEGGYATAAASALAAERGADVIRVHDVAENVAAVRTAGATRRGTDRDEN